VEHVTESIWTALVCTPSVRTRLVGATDDRHAESQLSYGAEQLRSQYGLGETERIPDGLACGEVVRCLHDADEDDRERPGLCLALHPLEHVEPSETGQPELQDHEQRERKASPGGLPCGTAEIDGILSIVERGDGVGDVRPPQGFRDEDGMATIAVDHQNRTRMYQGHGWSPSFRVLSAGLGTG
jgi:hypothetical protein